VHYYVSVNIKFFPGRFFTTAIILFVVLVAFGLRVVYLDAQSLRGDEAATILYSAIPLGDLWELSRITDPHPPLYYAMLHPWQRVAGDNSFTMRFAGVLASVLAVAVLYRVAHQTLGNIPLALLAAALLAINPLQIWLAQDVRSYPFFVLFGLLSSWALWAALKSAPTRSPFRALWPWLFYIVLTVTCVYIHYYTVFLIAFQGIFVLLNLKHFWNVKWKWGFSQVFIGVLILPGLGLAYNFVGGEAGGGVAVAGLAEIGQRTGAALLTGFTIEPTWGLWLSLLMLPIWLAGMVILLRQNRVSGSFWTLFLVVPVAGVIILALGRPLFKERFLVQAHPAFLVMISAGLLWLFNHRRYPGFIRFAGPVVASLMLLLLVSINFYAILNYHTDPAYVKAPPWHFYHDYLEEHYRPGDVMLTNFPEAAVSYYSPDGIPFYVVPAERGLTTTDRETATSAIAEAYDRIWFLPLLREGFDEKGEVLYWLDRHADRVNQVFFPVFNLNLYLSPTQIAQQLIVQPAAFSNGIKLRGFQVWNERGESRLDAERDLPLLHLAPEDDFTVSLYWEAESPPEESFTVFVHVVAADGFNRTSQDNIPVWGSYPTGSWRPGEQVTDKYTLTLPPGTPPGEHYVRVGWYDSVSGERVPVLDAENRPIDDHVILNMGVLVE
jgi:hypothetical protein